MSDDSASEGPAPAPRSSSTGAVPRGAPLGTALERLRDSPYGRNAHDRLSTVTAEVVKSLAKGELEQCVAVVADVIGLEEQATDDDTRRSYLTSLRRMLSGQLLEQVIPLLLDPLYKRDVENVLRRAGVDGTDVLLKQLIAAPTLAERRTYFQALCGMSEGAELAVRLLEDNTWFVVRNMAELVGELHMEEAVPKLGKTLDHKDPRVRRSAAGALAKIGTTATGRHLGKALKDEDVETRAAAARGLSGRKSAALVMPLILAAANEEDDEVKREFYLALGRIGTPEAVQALIKAVAPGGRFLGRKPIGPRLAAVEGLHLAGGRAAIDSLTGLVKDPVKAVRVAARKALEELQG